MSGFNFGGGASKPTSGGLFGAAKTTEASTGGFSFGGGSTTSAAPSGGFSFGAKPAATTTASATPTFR